MQRQPGCWLRSSHSLKECVTAHWSSGSAPKINGAKRCTEAMELLKRKLVGERTAGSGSMTGTTCGSAGSANVGMSNEREVRILPVENPRFPGEGSSAQGKSGPKARPRGVVDGQQVEIPVLPADV